MPQLRLKAVASSEITTERHYQRRREFLRQLGAFTVTAGGVGGALVGLSSRGQADPPPAPPRNPWTIAQRGRFSTEETATPFADVATYNNFYELGLSKSAPAKNADALKLRPWQVAIEGEVKKPAVVDIDKLIGWFDLEERIYRMRCVEAWSMVIPWLGFPLVDLIARVEPTSRAQWVAFETIYDPENLPGQKTDSLKWPYVEGLRIDEAVNPLTMLAVGVYGAPALAQNGAPIRLVVPWKYGFKGIKSIVKIRFTEQPPPTSWSLAAPDEYGFYANVNPAVSHPRWSQASERRIGELSRRPTLMFNGYADHVANMYSSMDLTRNF